MELETERILKKVAQTKNIAEKGKLVQKEVSFLSPQTVTALETEKKQIQDSLAQPEWARRDITARQVEELNERVENIETQLTEQAPPRVSGQAKDALNARRLELEDKIRAGMVADEEMRRNPTGSVYKHIKWEKDNIFDVLEWKNIKRVLEPDSEDPELCSVELLRPSILPQSGSTFMADSQIPGHFAMTAKAKENFDKTFPDSPTIDTPLKQLGRSEAEERLAKLELELKDLKATASPKSIKRHVDLETRAKQRASRIKWLANKQAKDRIELDNLGKEKPDVNPQA